MKPSTRHHLLLVAESFPTSLDADVTGGVEMGDFQVSQHLSHEYQITVLTMARPNTSRDQMFGSVRVLRVGRRVEVSQRESLVARIWFGLAAVYHSLGLDADLIHGSNTISIVLAAIIGGIKRKPVLAMVPDVYGKDWWKLYPFASAWLGYILEQISIRLPITYMTYTKVVAKQLKNYGKHAVVVGGGVTDYVSRPKKQPVLVYAGRLVAYKHPEVALLAFAELCQAFPDLYLTIIGDGPLRPRIEAMIAAMKLKSRVKLLGLLASHDEVLSEIAKASILIHPSGREGYGFAVLEAAAVGTPFIHTDLPVTREITASKGGVLVPEASVYHVVEAAARLLTDQDLYQHYLQELPTILRRHTWKRASQKRRQVIETLLAQSS